MNQSTKTPTHDTTGLWWNFGTYSRWHNQNKHKYAWFDMIPANIKLAAAIRFLAKGDNYTNLQYQVLSR